MRQRKVKNLEQRLEEFNGWLVDDPTAYRGKWQSLFEKPQPLFLEIGCGKGAFLAKQTQIHENRNFLGLEGSESVLLRALEKAAQAELKHVKFLSCYLRNMQDLFAAGELDGIYLNFSDPWPKDRHAKRRLTHGDFLRSYKQALSPKGNIEIKTDNDALYQFTMEEIRLLQWEIKAHTTDLHSSSLSAREIMTEYETKFHSAGKNIYYIKL